MFLLCMAWQSERHGYLADDDDKLRRWSRMTREQWSQSRESLLAKFPVIETGWRANTRMIREAEKQTAFSESQSAKGKLGGRPKNPGNKAEIKPGVSNEKPELSVGLSPEKPSVSVSASDTASGEENKNISAPAEPHPEASLAGESDKAPQLVSIETKRNERRKRSYDTAKTYEPRFLDAYEIYPKHEEKSISETEWLKAYRRLQKGEKDKPPMRPDEAAEFLEKAAADFAAKMTDRDLQYIRSMRRWLRDSNYLDYEPKPKNEFYVLSPEEQAAQWDRDFGTAVNHG